MLYQILSNVVEAVNAKNEEGNCAIVVVIGMLVLAFVIISALHTIPGCEDMVTTCLYSALR